MQDDELQHFRRRKDQVFRDEHHSPIPADQRNSFGGLRYVPPAPDLAFDLDVEPADGSTLEIRTSDGSRRRSRRSGRVRFEVDEEGFFLEPYPTERTATADLDTTSRGAQ